MKVQSMLAAAAVAAMATVSQATTPSGGKTVTNYTSGTTNQALKDYDTGAIGALGNLSVTSGLLATAGGQNAAAGTPLYNAFNGYVDLTGAIYSASATLTFSGLDSASYQYDLAVSSDRSATTNEWVSKLTISGADAFTNTSSSGTFSAWPGAAGPSVTFQTFNASTDASTLMPLDNSKLANNVTAGPGYIARWSGINPGSDNTFTVTFAQNVSGVGNGYVNGFRLEATLIPEPASVALLGLSILALSRRRRA